MFIYSYVQCRRKEASCFNWVQTSQLRSNGSSTYKTCSNTDYKCTPEYWNLVLKSGVLVIFIFMTHKQYTHPRVAIHNILK